MKLMSKTWDGKKTFVFIVCALLLFGVWYAFRPEKLFTNVKVNEAAPAGLNGTLTPLYTGRFFSESQKASGRATIFKQQDGSRILKLSDFSTSAQSGLHVLLLAGDAAPGGSLPVGRAKSIDLGTLSVGSQAQAFPIPDTADLATLDTVALYQEQSHLNLGSAHLEEF